MKAGKRPRLIRLAKADVDTLAAAVRIYAERGWSVEDGRRALERYAEAEAAEAALKGKATNDQEACRCGRAIEEPVGLPAQDVRSR